MKSTRIKPPSTSNTGTTRLPNTPPEKKVMSTTPAHNKGTKIPMERLVRQLRLSKKNKDLSFRTTVIPDGAMKGRVIIEVLTKAGFRLFDLPPELRERIYGFVFAEPTGYKIDIYRSSIRMDAQRDFLEGIFLKKVVHGGDFRNVRTHKGQKWDDQRLKWIGGPPNVLSLLRVNRQIHAEATPVAYGTNRFVLYSNKFACAQRFIRVIGPSAQFLRDIQIRDISSLKQLHHILMALSNAPGVRRLVVPDLLATVSARSAAKNHDNPDSWACAFHKVIRLDLMDIKKKYKASNRCWRASDFIQFANESAPLDVAQLDKDFEIFEAAFREIARAYLDEE
ncbi:hypothetical protein CBER1_00497 [Cercospora berteroae]|uniref:Uncharacterized protein n=1 Tax=Cercospora berteroae TaxID=357750 RepID=A0A2S6CB91_9PEZI|nr:hypothetical protein CBER1_00497 [Cercospora berteroae]